MGDFQKCTASSYVYVTIYGHKKKVCLEQTISVGSIVWNLGHFMLHFTTFHNVSIYV